MNKFNWQKVEEKARRVAEEDFLNPGQKASVLAVVRRLRNNGVIVADEVGMGKTRVAVGVIKAVLAAGGRVAALIPPGLGFQWRDELRRGGVPAKPVVRTMKQYYDVWKENGPLFNENLTLISHGLFNWRITESEDSIWRWRMFAELFALWSKRETGKRPRGYLADSLNWRDKRGVRQAAASVMETLDRGDSPVSLPDSLIEIFAAAKWREAINKANYKKNGKYWDALHSAIGAGFGAFDLVVIDEAHKSRGDETLLTRLLKVIVPREPRRALALTATPIELDPEQWGSILARVDFEIDKEIIYEYLNAARKVQNNPLDASAREEFFLRAKKFQRAFYPCLLRRDKREETSIRQFGELTQSDYRAYRRTREIRVKPSTLSDPWKQTLCAVEALSFLSERSSALKRARLTITNGHAVAALVDSFIVNDADLEKLKKEREADIATNKKRGLKNVAIQDKTIDLIDDSQIDSRADWWLRVLRKSLKTDAGNLYDHPAILAVVEEIEKIRERREKVLIFGVFKKPLRALTDLLNAREMLRRLEIGIPWPGETLGNEDALKAALRQTRSRNIPRRLDAIKEMVAEQYKNLEKKRSANRYELLNKLTAGFSETPANDKYRRIFEAFKNDAGRRVKDGDGEKGKLTWLILVDRALREIAGEDYGDSPAEKIKSAFIELTRALSDQERAEDEDDEDAPRDDIAWEEIRERLAEEFDARVGGFARMMDGDSAPRTRRYLQLAFNREASALKALVAQSRVGREGLNLHKACRTIILLHLEWNPGVVEQQIGRVDRLGSLWEKIFEEKKNVVAPEELSRIEFMPVIFEGTYDERIWKKFTERTSNLRAQLSGAVISSEQAERYDDRRAIDELNAKAPKFYPETE